MTGFKFFIGIDQTGGSRNNKALPLPSALFNSKTKELLVKPLHSLTFEDVIKTYPQVDLKKTFILVDSVIGLPSSCIKHGNFNWSFFEKCFLQKDLKSPYGRDSAHQFFSQFVSGVGPLPKRKCEVLANANSVFKKIPFQKNIAAGTHRIWMDLGASKKWLNLFHFEKRSTKKGPTLCEGYPSLVWKNLLGFKHRKPHLLSSYLKKNSRLKLTQNTSHLIASNANYADAAVLAYAGWKISQTPHFTKIPKFVGLNKEGWILGLKL